MQRENKKHYAWKIMLACIFIKVGTGGASMAMMNNFVNPIVTELGCQVSQLTMTISINAISMALLYTTASRILTTKKIGLVMGFASLAEVVGIALMSTYRSVEMFYLSGFITGAAQSFTGLVAIPLVINMWFRKKTGTVLGIVIAIGNAAGVLYGLLSAQLITSLGWRTSYLILAVMGLVLTVPMVFLVIKSPAEAGCEPYGAEDGDAPAAALPGNSGGDWGLTRGEAFRSPFLYVAWAACIFYSYGSGVAGYIVPFSTMELGQTINFGARVGMFASFGAILCSLILGRLNDRFGVKAGLVWGAAATAAGYGILLLTPGAALLAYLGAFVVGLGNAMYMVQCPLLARSVAGNKHFSDIWPIMMMANSLIGGGLYSSIGLFYDRGGSYRGAFVMAVALYMAALATGALAVDLGKKHRQKMGSAA